MPVVQQPAPAPEPVENVSGRVDQEVQTDFVNPPSPQQQITSGTLLSLCGRIFWWGGVMKSEDGFPLFRQSYRNTDL